MATGSNSSITLSAAFDLALRLLKRGHARLTRIQRPIVLTYTYILEIQNGGHSQFLHNHGFLRAHATVAALSEVGAHRMEKVLGAVLPIYQRRLNSLAGREARTIGDFERGRLKELLDRADKVFDANSGYVESCLQHYVANHWPACSEFQKVKRDRR